MEEHAYQMLSNKNLNVTAPTAGMAHDAAVQIFQIKNNLIMYIEEFINHILYCINFRQRFLLQTRMS